MSDLFFNPLDIVPSGRGGSVKSDYTCHLLRGTKKDSVTKIKKPNLNYTLYLSGPINQFSTSNCYSWAISSGKLYVVELTPERIKENPRLDGLGYRAYRGRHVVKLSISIDEKLCPDEYRRRVEIAADGKLHFQVTKIEDGIFLLENTSVTSYNSTQDRIQEVSNVSRGRQ